jgi:hypothetical protein
VTRHRQGAQRTPLELSVDLLRAAVGLLLANVTPDGSGVDFARLLQLSDFRAFQTMTASLQTVNLGPLSASAVTSFFVNIVNVLFIHAFLMAGVPQEEIGASLVRRFASYDIGGMPFTPDVIVNGLLRANCDRHLRDDDPRLRYASARLDPRVHMLVCDQSPLSPSPFLVNAETPSRLVTLLDAATQEFLNEHVRVDVARHSIVLPPQFQQFEADFCNHAAQLPDAADLLDGELDDVNSRDALLLLAWLRQHSDADDLGVRLNQLADDKELTFHFLSSEFALTVRPFRQSM